MTQPTPSGDAKAGLFLIRLLVAVAWCVAAWFALTRTAQFEFPVALRWVLAGVCGSMGALTLVWALFARDHKQD